jgi:hypothetical protein
MRLASEEGINLSVLLIRGKEIGSDEIPLINMGYRRSLKVADLV